MLTFPRFIVALIFIIGAFVIAWQSGLDLDQLIQDKNLDWLAKVGETGAGETEKTGDSSESSTAISSDKTAKSDVDSSGPWNRDQETEIQDFSNIAIRDPEADSIIRFDVAENENRIVVGPPTIQNKPKQLPPRTGIAIRR